MQCDGGLNRIAYDPHHFLPAVNGGFLPPLSPVPAPIAGWFNQKQERRREEFFFFFFCHALLRLKANLFSLSWNSLTCVSILVFLVDSQLR